MRLAIPILILLIQPSASAAGLLRCETKSGGFNGTFNLPSSGNPTLKISDDSGSAHQCSLVPKLVDAPDKGVMQGFWLSMAIDQCKPKLSDKAKEKFLPQPRLVGKWKEGGRLESRLQWLKKEQPSECVGQPASRKQLEAYFKTIPHQGS